MRYQEILNEASEYIETLRAKSEALRLALGKEYPIEIFFSVTSAGDLHLDQLIVRNPKERNQGIGTAVMTKLTQFCDENSIPMTLTPDVIMGTGQTSIKGLYSFYGRFGFKRNKGRTKDYRYSGTMIRRPSN